jgi:hypothetical protein
MFIYMVSCDNYKEWRKIISGHLHLNEAIIYSLPEGLWVFSITLTSKVLFFKVGDREIQLVFLPLIFSIGLELFQLLHLTNGRFDFWDIYASVLFWAVANYFIRYSTNSQNIFHPISLTSIICIFSYLIVYMAHVWSY